MSKMKLPEYEPLDDQLKLLKGDIRPDNALKTAVVTPTVNSVTIPPRTHVKQTVKAILLYAACITIFLGALMILPDLFEGNPPMGTQPPDTDTLTDTHLSESEKQLYHAAWAALKDSVPDDYTINDLLFPGVWIQCGDAFICSSYKWEQTKNLTIGLVRDPLSVAGYFFYSGRQFTVFANDRAYKLDQAFTDGIVSADDLSRFYKAYREKNPTLAYLADPSDPSRDRDHLTNPDQFTALQREVIYTLWNQRKDQYLNNPLHVDYSINTIADYIQRTFFFPCGNGCVLFAPENDEVNNSVTSEFIAGYLFRYHDSDTLDYYENGNFCSLAEAYDAGMVSANAIRLVWEAYNPTNDLHKLLINKTCVNDRIDSSSLHANLVFEPDDPTNTGIEKLFDGIKTEADYTAAGTGVLRGKAPEFSCFLFDMTEKVKLSAYVITTGNDVHAHTEQNPLAWHLYATNDADAAAAMRGTDAHYEEIIRGNDQWIDLDYVWDGQMTANSFCSNGYVIDESMQGEYQYYCWVIEYAGGTHIQVAELELYSN